MVNTIQSVKEMIIADLDMKQIAYSQFDFGPVGHYARPDVFKLFVNKEKQESIEWNSNNRIFCRFLKREFGFFTCLRGKNLSY